MDNLVGPRIPKIGGEANGEAREDVVDVVVLVEDAEVETVVGAKEEAEAVLDHMILLLATVVGCVAIWPVTVPNLLSHREVALPALPEENLHNPCIEAQEEEAEDGLFGSGASMSYMTRLGMNTQWTMQVNCTSPSAMNLLRPMRGLRRKSLKKQKTKKNLCQCSRCWSYTVFVWHEFAKRKEKEKCGGNL